MPKLIDIAGKKYGRILVVERAGVTQDGRAAWLCLCDCGRKKIISGKSIRNGDSRSCGCLHIESSIRNLPKNELKIGSRRVTNNGYVEIKTILGWVREHVYVMENYIGRKVLAGEVVHHKDGDKQNNDIENLEIMSAGDHSALHNHGRKVNEDTKRRISEGIKRRVRLRGHKGRKLVESDVLEIRRKYVRGLYGYMSLAKEYGVTPATIRCIVNRKTWKNI